MNRVLSLLAITLFSAAGLMAQSVGSISGKITDSYGQPIADANISVSGGQYGDASDENGIYLIPNLKSGNFTLVVTSQGFTTQTMEVQVVAGESAEQNFELQDAYSLLDEIVVDGDLYSDEYLSNATTVGTKIPVHPKELPVGLDVLSSYMLQQMEPVRITDAVQYVSGVNQETGFGGRTDIYVIRGFRSDRESIFKNGFRNPMRVYRESSNIQQIEVIKGPASALYGVSDPGGTVNIATKKPKSVKHGSVDMVANSYGMVRPSFDLGGPLDDEGRMKFRLNGALEAGGTYRDQISTERYFLAPVFSYQINPKTTFTFEGEYLKHNQPTDRGVPIYDPTHDKHYDFDPSKSFGDPYNETTNTNSLTQFELAHKFHENWSFRTAGNLLFTDGERTAVEVGGFVAEDTVKRYYQDQRHKEKYFAWQNEILGSFKLGNTEHKTVFGFELANTSTDMFIQRDKTYDEVSVYDTDYKQMPVADMELSTSHDYTYETRNYGFYFQDFVTLTSWLNLIGGLRYDIYESVYDNRLKDSYTKSTYQGISPRIGFLAKATKDISFFANYSEGFNPQWGNPADKEGNVFDPLRNKSFDVGAKFYFKDDKFNITATYFDLTRQGMLVDDPTDQDYRIQTGEAASNGVEIDVQGEPLPGWTFMTSYSYTNARITEDTEEARIGQPLENVAPHMYKLWMNYEIQRGSMKGFGAGMGYNYVSERAADDGIDKEKLDAYNLLEGSLFYRSNRWKTTLTVKNLSDARYYVGSQNYNRAMPGAPRHFTLSFNYLF